LCYLYRRLWRCLTKGEVVVLYTLTTSDIAGKFTLIPKRHVKSFFELQAIEKTEVLQALDEAKEALDKEFSPDGYNIGINDGEAAGQTVMHLHVHLIPRYEGDMEDPRSGVRWIFPEKAKYWETQ